MSTRLDDSNSSNSNDHPEHRIYRKSVIRFSLLQRFRAIITEEQKRNGKLPTYKQGSKSMGEKIANQDYADPAKLLFAASRNPSELNLSTADVEEKDDEEAEEEEEEEFEKLDLSINESDVLREIEKRLEVVDTGQEAAIENGGVKSSQSCNCLSSSQSAECFYETIMERKLDDEVDGDVKKRVESFSDNNKSVVHNKMPLKRPNKAPPPIPVKPKGLSNIPSAKIITNNDNNVAKTNSKSWVKTMVGRFE